MTEAIERPTFCIMSSTNAAVDGEDKVIRLRAAQLAPGGERRSVRHCANASLAVTLGVSPMTMLHWDHGRTEPRLEIAVAHRQPLEGLRGATR